MLLTFSGQTREAVMKKSTLKKGCVGLCLFITTLSTVMLQTASAKQIPAVVDLDPDTVNLAGNRKWITAYIELPSPDDAGDIDAGTVFLRVNGNDIYSEFKPTDVGDHDGDGVHDLMVKFDAGTLQSHLFLGLQTLAVIGETVGGDEFEGKDTITVLLNEKNPSAFTLLQTSDLHNHASGYGPFLDYTPSTTGDDDVCGGFARLATLIGGVRQERATAKIPTLLVDSGDFFMGTTYDLTAEDPVILKFFQLMKYDAVTLGNHEFDWGPQGLAFLLGNASAKGFSVPVVASNMAANGSALESLPEGTIVEKKIIDLPNSLRIGILGLMGQDSDQKAPVAYPVAFEHDFDIIQSHVDELRKVDGVDLVVVLSHGGVYGDNSGDDIALARNVTGIDIIASGHTHTFTEKAIVTGSSNTIIIEPGEYGEFLSRLDITYSEDLGRVVGYHMNLLPVNDAVPGLPGVQALVAAYNVGVDSALSAAGLPKLADPITTTGFDLELVPFNVTGLGSLCADAVRAVANAVAPFNYSEPIEISVVPSGVIRDPILAGNTGVVSFSDVYNCLPLGISPFQSSPPGYPLMHLYLNGMEVYTMCEVGLSLSQMLDDDYYLNFSGIRIVYDPAKASTFSGVQAVYLYSPADPFCTGPSEMVNPFDPDRLYHVAVDLYTLQMLNVVTAYGFPLAPKKADGTPLSPADYINYRIDATPASGVLELKEWMALTNFLPGLGGSIPSGIYGPDGTVLNRVSYTTSP